MSNLSELKLYTESYVDDIAVALKEKYTKPTDPQTYTIRQMANAVRGLALPIPDWTEIGYDTTPKSVLDNFEYSKTIHDEWDASIADRSGQFAGNSDLVWFPQVDMSNVTNASSMFASCPNLEGLYVHQTFPALVNGELMVSQAVHGSVWNSDIDWDMPNCTTLVKAFMSLGGRPKNAATSWYTSLRISVKLNIPKVTNLYEAFYMQGGEVSTTKIGSVELITSGSLQTLEGTFHSNTGLTSCIISNTSGVGFNDGGAWSGTFDGCSNLSYLSTLNMQYCLTLEGTFAGCSKLKSVNTTSPIGSADRMIRGVAAFDGCTLLEDIPEMNIKDLPFGNSQYLENMVRGCPNLTNRSVDNILKACAESGCTDGNRTLTQLGFTEAYYPVSRLEQLDHYQAYLDAGWTTGY